MPALKHLGIVLLVCVAMALEGNPKVVLRPLVVFGLLPIAIAAPVFWAWSGVVLVLGVAEAHRFSAGRGLASAGLARLVLWGLLAAAALVGIRPF